MRRNCGRKESGKRDRWMAVSCPLAHLHSTWARRREEGNGKGEAVQGKERRRD